MSLIPVNYDKGAHLAGDPKRKGWEILLGVGSTICETGSKHKMNQDKNIIKRWPAAAIKWGMMGNNGKPREMIKGIK